MVFSRAVLSNPRAERAHLHAVEKRDDSAVPRYAKVCQPGDAPTRVP